MENMVSQDQLKSFYKGKKVFLTGHTGFKGSWFLYWLHLLEADVKGYALAPQAEENLFDLIQGQELCNSIIADIRDKKRLEEEILEFEPDIIFHFAAQPLVRLSYEIPSETFEVNAIGTSFLFDALRKLSKPCITVVITTDKVYENQEWVYPYRENDRLGGYDPYSASKACTELVVNSYRHSFFNSSNYQVHQKAIATARAGNVIGGGDWSKDRIIPDIIRSLRNNEVVQVRNPTAVRPWQHVMEPLGGYLMLALKLHHDPVKYSEPWNFGPLMEDHLSVQQLVGHAIHTWGTGNFDMANLPDQPHEAGLLKLDINKTVNLLSWKPKYDSLEAIKLTINWYKQYYFAETSAALLIEKDIENFIKGV